jgi:hypothetical protein
MEAGKFFTTETGQIFPFVGITKYDILTPEKNQSGPAGEQEGYGGEEETPENNPRRDPAGTEAALAERNQKLEAERLERYKLAEKGLKFLDILFPEAYWLDLGPAADLFPYFQPLYQFPDGFNLLSPENPVQVIIVLLRIIEDFFRGCRNVEFRLPEDSERNTEWFTQAMTDWMGYREVLFEKNYSTDLKDYVNNLYSKPDFQHSAIGKKLMFNLLWQTKSYFLPFFKVDQIAFEKPSREASTLTPLHRRVRELRDVFEALSEMVDVTAVNRGPVAEIPNAWEKYKFDLDNVVSVRLDALLGAKKNSPIAVNANVVKHTASILAVLDWWINDETSPAHASNDFRLFRVSPLDGRPMFSVPLLTNQSELFRQGLKKLAAQQAPAPQEAPQQAAPAPQTAAPQQTQPQNAGQSG